jgi:hypothetical protein
MMPKTAEAVALPAARGPLQPRHASHSWRSRSVSFSAGARPSANPGSYVLSRGSFTSTDLAAKIDSYVTWYLATDHPFRWSYRPQVVASTLTLT